MLMRPCRIISRRNEFDVCRSDAVGCCRRYGPTFLRSCYEFDYTSSVVVPRVPGSGSYAMAVFPCLCLGARAKWAVALGAAALTECAHPECLTMQDERLSSVSSAL